MKATKCTNSFSCSWIISSLSLLMALPTSSLLSSSYHEETKNDIIVSSSSIKKEVWIPVDMWNEDGEILLDNKKENKGPPRYLVGKAASASSTCRNLSGTHIEKDGSNIRKGQKTVQGSLPKTSPSFSSSSIQHFTFDLGNPGDTTFLVDGCRGCTPPDVDINNDNACPLYLPSCDRGNIEKDDTNDICWPSRSDEYWTFDHACDIEEASEEMFQCKIEVLPEEIGNENNALAKDYKPYRHNKYKYKRVCMMCFDGGNHSRYFVPSQANNLIFLKQNDRHILNNGNIPHTHTTRNDYIDRNIGNVDDNYYQLPDNFQFGALVRTIPLQDRIWSNVGIGYNSSFFRQTGITSFQFSFHKKSKTTSLGTTISAHHVIFNPTSHQYIHAKDIASQTYETPHQRIHHLDGFKIGNSNNVLNGGIHDYANESNTFSSSTATSATTDLTSTIECFMDTGNGGIFIAHENLRRELAEATGGYWGNYEDGVESTTKQLIVPNYINNTDIVPDLHIIFTPGIQVTMKGHMWVPNQGKGETIFVSTSNHYTILGLPFISSGLDLVFDDEHKQMYLFGENVKKLEDNKKDSGSSNNESLPSTNNINLLVPPLTGGQSSV